MDPEQGSDRAGPEREERRRLLRRLVNFKPRELRELWKLGAFVGLGLGPRALFVALVSRMNVDTMEAFPSQSLLADEIESGLRSVERWTTVLVERGIINARVLRARGVLHYELGPASYAAVREYVTEHASQHVVDLVAVERIEQLERENSILRELVASGEAAAVRIRCTSSSSRLIGGTGDRPAAQASEVEASSRSQTPSSSSAAREEKKFEVVDEQASRVALGELHAKKHPRRPPRRVFDADELALVAHCASSVDGELETKLEALRFAIAGAWHSSSGPPSTRFIFGTLEHFEQHVDAGQRRARALERRPTSPPREAVARPIEPDELADVGDVLEQLKAIGMG